MSCFCSKCGKVFTEDGVFCPFCGAKRTFPVMPEPRVTQCAPPQAGIVPDKQRHKSVLGQVAIITAAVVVVVCTASYFLFFADNEPSTQTAMKPSAVITERTDEGTVSAEATQTIEPTAILTAEPIETVNSETIKVSMAYDSGEGVYTGEVNNDGVPNGYGSFKMVTSDTGANWIYEGHWQNGEITGEGVMTQDDFVFTGSFKSGLMDGYCEISDGGILRYKGMCAGGKLHGAGTLYTSSGLLLFEGEFDNDMLVENAVSRQARGEAFKPECMDMDEMLYDGCMAEDNTFGYPVAVWGFSLAMGEQDANGTIVIGHMGDDSYSVCLVYRYGVDEPKMTEDDWINAWGVVVGIYEYVDADGLTVTCPMIEVVCWNNEQEGL